MKELTTVEQRRLDLAEKVTRVYLWASIVIIILLGILAPEEVFIIDNLGLGIKQVIFLTYVHHKHNWYKLTAFLALFTIMFGLQYNGFSWIDLVDFTGLIAMLVTIYYREKYNDQPHNKNEWWRIW